MKVEVRGNVAIVTTKINYEQLKKAGKVVLCKDNEELYAAEVTGKGSMTPYGITFGYADKDGNACFTKQYPEGTSADAIKEAMNDVAFRNAVAFEDAIVEAVVAAVTAKDEAAALITIQ